MQYFLCMLCIFRCKYVMFFLFFFLGFLNAMYGRAGILIKFWYRHDILSTCIVSLLFMKNIEKVKFIAVYVHYVNIEEASPRLKQWIAVGNSGFSMMFNEFCHCWEWKVNGRREWAATCPKTKRGLCCKQSSLHELFNYYDYVATLPLKIVATDSSTKQRKTWYASIELWMSTISSLTTHRHRENRNGL